MKTITLIIFLLLMSCSSTVGPNREILYAESSPQKKVIEPWLIGKWVSDTFVDPSTSNSGYYHRALIVTPEQVEIICYQNNRIWEHTITTMWLMTDSLIYLWQRDEQISGHGISSRNIKHRNKLELWEPSVSRELYRWVRYRKVEQ